MQLIANAIRFGALLTPAKLVGDEVFERVPHSRKDTDYNRPLRNFPRVFPSQLECNFCAAADAFFVAYCGIDICSCVCHTQFSEEKLVAYVFS